MIKRHTFENGFQLVYQKSEQTIPITCVHVFCNVGSAYEIDSIRGASHFVEHLCFKGTEKHKTPHNLLVEYNKVGAQINAYTEKRVTCYHMTCDDTHVNESMNTFSDMILHASFPRKEFNKEQHVVVEENIRTKDNHAYMLEKQLDKLYFNGSDYQHPIDTIDYHPTATHLTYEDMYQWYKWFYHPANMVCSVVSTLSFSVIQDMIRATSFMNTDRNNLAPLYFYPTLTLQPITTHFSYYKKKGISSTILHVGFRTCNYYNKDKYIIQLLLHILNGFSGMLFSLFRTKHGLTYHSSAHVTYHEHAGYMNFFIQTDPTKLIYNGKKDGCVPILLHLITDLIRNGITENQLEVAKGNIKGKLLLELQSIETLATYNGMSAVLQSNDIPLQYIYKTHIHPITCNQVHDIICKYMTYDNLVVGIAHDHDIPTEKIEHMFSVLH